MSITQQMAKHLRDVHFGGNWTTSCYKDQLADVSWKEATIKVQLFNTIAVLVYHTHYFVIAVLKVLQGGPLDSKDEYSFNHPPIKSEEDWLALLDSVWINAEAFAKEIEKLPDSKLEDNFIDSKYGTYYRNLAGIIEHHHYHLGQIALIKKLLKNTD